MRTAGWLFLAAAIVLPDAAWACSCVPASPCSQYNSVDAIFLGNVVAVRREGSLLVATLDVIRTWKGRVDRKVTLSNAAGTSCSFDFVVGQRFLAYGDGAGATFRTFMCMGGGSLPPEAPEPDLPPPAGRVSGRVARFEDTPSRTQRDTLIPIRSTRVWMATASGVLETRTDGEGRFTLDGIPAGSHVVRADVGPAFEAGQRVELESASDCAHVFITPRLSGRLTGKLSSAATPVRGVEIYAVPVDHDWTKHDLSDSPRTTADDTGQFEFSGLRPGRYLLTVNVMHVPRVSQPFAPSYYPGVERREDAVAIAVGQGRAGPSEPFKLTRTFPLTTIAADIICRDGSMPRSGLVYARQIDARNYLTESTYTQVDGRFQLTVMAGVPYEVHGEVLVDVRDETGRSSGFTGLRTPAVRVEPGTTSIIRLVAPRDRCQETTIDGSLPRGR